MSKIKDVIELLEQAERCIRPPSSFCERAYSSIVQAVALLKQRPTLEDAELPEGFILVRADSFMGKVYDDYIKWLEQQPKCKTCRDTKWVKEEGDLQVGHERYWKKYTPCPKCRPKPVCETCGGSRELQPTKEEREEYKREHKHIISVLCFNCQQSETEKFTKALREQYESIDLALWVTRKEAELIRNTLNKIPEACDLIDQLKLAFDERCRVIEMQLNDKEQLQAEIKQLKSIFDHPNHDIPKRRYLYEIKNAAMLLETFSKDECGECGGGGEYVYGVVVQLRQFVEKAKQTLKEAK